MFFLLGGLDDPHIAFVDAYLQARAEETTVIDTRQIPRTTNLQIKRKKCDGKTCHYPWMLSTCDGIDEGIEIKKNDIFYWRTIFSAPAHFGYEYQHNFDSMVRSWLKLCHFHGSQFVNQPAAYHRHAEKPSQFMSIANLNTCNISMPQTVWTTDCHRSRPWIDPCIMKPVQGGSDIRIIDPENPCDISIPGTFQEYIEGENIRVFVIGDGNHGRTVMSYEVKSKMLDYRNDPDAVVVPCSIPSSIQAEVIRIARNELLNFCAFDLIRRPEDDQYYFLEVNPAPMWIGFDRQIGVALCAYLVLMAISQEDAQDDQE